MLLVFASKGQEAGAGGLQLIGQQPQPAEQQQKDV